MAELINQNEREGGNKFDVVKVVLPTGTTSLAELVPRGNQQTVIHPDGSAEFYETVDGIKTLL